MALFSKPPAKKPAPPAAGARPAAPSARPTTAREIAAQARSQEKPKVEPVAADITVTGASIIEWTPGQPSFEVAQANPGLCSVLENAALLYANGNAGAACALLEEGVQNDHDAKLSPLAWLALFDLLQRAGDKVKFDQMALKYVVQFERSPPVWEEQGKAQPGAAPKMPGGFLAISGRLSATSGAQVEPLRRAITKAAAGVRLDLGAVVGFDDAGASMLAGALAEARRKRLVMTIQKADKLRAQLTAAVKGGREAGEGAWQLLLELLQWSHEQEAFDERAIDYAVTFEMSPPSWEPPPAPPAAEPVAAADGAPEAAPADRVVWNGVIAGNATANVAALAQFAQGRSVVPLDLTAVERVDFVCAGALLNAIDRIEGQRKAVQIVGASPIVRALLLLIGISPRHFVRKSP